MKIQLLILFLILTINLPAQEDQLTPQEKAIQQMEQLSRLTKKNRTNEELYNFALHRKELRLIGIKEVHEEKRTLFQTTEGRDNFYSEASEDYNYDKQKTKEGKSDNAVIKEEEDLLLKQEQIEMMPIRNAMEVKNIKWEQIHSMLSPKSAAIEFIRFKETKETSKDTETYLYAAMVLRSDYDKPEKVILGSTSKLQELLKVSSEFSPDKLYTRGGFALGSNISPGSEIYNLVWADVDLLLDGIEEVYYAPDGILHELSFAALQDENKEYLSSKYKLHQLGTTRTLINGVADVYPPKESCWILAGGLSYEKVPHLPSISKSTACAIVMDSIPLSINIPRPSKVDKLELPGTQQEINAVAVMLEKEGINFQKFSGAKGPEEFFKRLGGYFIAPGVLHIGTHGFYIPNVLGSKNGTKAKAEAGSQQTREAAASGQLAGQCGLYLSGAANNYFNRFSYNHTENGFWTAEEIAGQSLLETKLVVLSACNSGRGNTQIKSGIFGLQGAFKTAGVDKMIVSLWEISDAGTAVFMESFYSHWLSGKTAYQAFQFTQRDMQKHPIYNTPYYWAAFVLLE